MAKESITTCPKCYRETCDTETLRKASERVNLVAFRVLRTEAEKVNMSDDEMLIQTLKSYGLLKLYTCLTETSAEKLLQELA